MEIRHIEDREDVRGLVRTHGLAWREAYDGLLPADVLEAQSVDPDEAEVDRWMAGIEANREGVLVAVLDGAVRGFVDIRWGDAETKVFVGEGEADLKAIYVEPDYWGEGVGSKLLERGLDLLPDSVGTVRLDVFAENESARQFYESHGFEQTGRDEHEIAERSFPVAIYSLHR